MNSPFYNLGLMLNLLDFKNKGLSKKILLKANPSKNPTGFLNSIDSVVKFQNEILEKSAFHSVGIKQPIVSAGDLKNYDAKQARFEFFKGLNHLYPKKENN